MASFYFLRPFIVLVYTSVEHSVESWACLLSNGGKNTTAEALCTELRSARFLLIPLFVFGVGFLALNLWLRFGRNQGQYSQHGDIARDSGIDGAKTQV